MNERPWPTTTREITPVNVTATSDPMMQQVLATLNSLIYEFNNLQQQIASGAIGSGSNSKTTLKPFDGASPAHDGAGWYIDNQCLKAFPGPNGKLILGPIVCPQRLILPEA